MSIAFSALIGWITSAPSRIWAEREAHRTEQAEACVVRCLLMLHNFWGEIWSMLRCLTCSVKFCPHGLAVNANSLFKEPCKGWTKSVRVFGTGKSRVAWPIKLHGEIDRNYPLRPATSYASSRRYWSQVCQPMTRCRGQNGSYHEKNTCFRVGIGYINLVKMMTIPQIHFAMLPLDFPLPLLSRFNRAISGFFWIGKKPAFNKKETIRSSGGGWSRMAKNRLVSPCLQSQSAI